RYYRRSIRLSSCSSHLYRLFLFFLICPHPSSTLFPYTTLFRSHSDSGEVPDDLKEAANPTYEVGSKAIIETDHMEGMKNAEATIDRKSTRLNSSHVSISYAVFCLKKKKKNIRK